MILSDFLDRNRPESRTPFRSRSKLICRSDGICVPLLLRPRPPRELFSDGSIPLFPLGLTSGYTSQWSSQKGVITILAVVAIPDQCHHHRQTRSGFRYRREFGILRHSKPLRTNKGNESPLCAPFHTFSRKFYSCRALVTRED